MHDIAGPEVALARMLSDWHLLDFLDTCGIMGKEDMKAIARVAAARTDEDRAVAVRRLNGLPGWETLMTIALETDPGPAAGPSALD